MRVLSIYYTHKPGGFCLRLYRALGAMAKHGGEVTYLTLDPPPDNFPSNVSVRLIPFPLSQRSGLLFWAIFLAWAALYTTWISLRWRPERILVFGATYAALCGPAALMSRAPITLFLRSAVFLIDSMSRKPRPIRWMSRMVDRIGIRFSRSVVCMTTAMKRQIETGLRINLDRALIIPNDVPTLEISTEIPIEFEGLRFPVVTVGVIDERKNVGLLCAAFDELAIEVPPTVMTLFIVGEGPSLAGLRNSAAPNVRILGWRSDARRLIASASLLVHPSRHEGMSNAVLEAVGSGIPVLASDIPEHRELFQLDSCFSANDPSELSSQLLRFAREPEFRRALTAAAAVTRKRLCFDWDLAVWHAVAE